MKTILLNTFVLTSLVLSAAPGISQNTLYTVVSVGDGDTLRVRAAGKTTTIRLGCIDAPERSQKPYGQQSTYRLKQLLPTGTAVQVREITRDRYDRTVAELFVGNKSVNLQMVQEGQAVVYRQYLDGCATTKDRYLQAEAQAKQKRLSYWNQKSPVMPWDYRRSQRGQPQASANISKKKLPQPHQFPSCVDSDCNCSDFKTQAQAQQVFNAFAGDKFRLDGDSDGVACESLR